MGVLLRQFHTSVNFGRSAHLQHKKFFGFWQLYKGNLLFPLWVGVGINLPFKACAVHFAAGNLHKTGLRNQESSGSRQPARTESAFPWWMWHVYPPEELEGLLPYRLLLSAKKQGKEENHRVFLLWTILPERKKASPRISTYSKRQIFARTEFLQCIVFVTNEAVGD